MLGDVQGAEQAGGYLETAGDQPQIPYGIDCLRDCPDLGACCRVFFLSCWGATTEKAFYELMQQQKAPFKHVRLPDGETSCIARCDQIDGTGKCKVYEQRPNTCRIFIPGSDFLCVLFLGPPEEHVFKFEQLPAVRALRGARSAT
jgi:hypothetical protein